MTALSPDELADFWALGIPVEASFVPEAEWQRAVVEHRVQATTCFSSMGTAETGWTRVTSPTWQREDCAVVPPGQVAERTEWAEMQDDRDVIGVCWSSFWDGQRNIALGQLPSDRHEAFVDECARMLVELEQAWPHDRDNPKRVLLVDWLITANTLSRDHVEAALEDIKSSSLSHLVRGVRARWLAPDIHRAYEAVLASAERGKQKDFYGHGNIAHQRVVRMQLLRFIVKLARRARSTP